MDIISESVGGDVTIVLIKFLLVLNLEVKALMVLYNKRVLQKKTD